MESTHTREPWNKGKLVGQKPKDIWAIRIQLLSGMALYAYNRPEAVVQEHH